MKFEYGVTTRKMTVTAVMAAMATVLMLLEFSLPFVPSFLKFDFSDLPALITSYALGPVYGVAVEIIKNLIHLPMTQTGGVGELANLLVGTALVFPAGLAYRKKRTKTSAIIGAFIGAVCASIISFPINYFITYPFYTNFMPLDTIIGAYSVIFPFIDTLPQALLMVNVPFTFLKGMISMVITVLVYKKLSPILKGSAKKK